MIVLRHIVVESEQSFGKPIEILTLSWDAMRLGQFSGSGLSEHILARANMHSEDARRLPFADAAGAEDIAGRLRRVDVDNQFWRFAR